MGGRSGPESVTALIGPAGGHVRLGDFEIIVPARAVSQETVFSIKLPPANRRALAVAEFAPHNVRFNVPVTVILPFRNVRGTRDDARVMWWSTKRERWIALPTQRTADGRISAQTKHLSFWASGDESGGLTTAGG
jgi:hypothetical protein